MNVEFVHIFLYTEIASRAVVSRLNSITATSS